MKKVNLKVFTLLMTLLILSSVNVFAQKEGSSTKKEVKKKVVIVQKTKDKDGKIVVKRIEKEGDEATKYLKELKIEGKDGKIIDIDVNIDEIQNIGNDIEVIEIENWDNASEEIKKKLKDLDIDLEILDGKLELLDGKLEGLSDEFEIIELEGTANHFEVMGMHQPENHLMITPKKGEEQKVETIDISVDDDKYEVKIVMDGQAKNYKWEGDIPANVKQEIEALGFDVKQGKVENITEWLNDSGDNMRIKVGKDKKIRFFNSDKEVHVGFPYDTKEHLNIEPTDKIKDKVENININLNDDEYTLDIKIDGQDKKYNWKGEIPENIKKELTEMGFKVSMQKGHPKGRSIWINDELVSDGVFLGIQMGDKRSDLGVLIDGVVEGSAAEAAGLQAGDIITAIGDKSTDKFRDLVEALDAYKIGDKTEISYIRGDNTAKTTVSFEKGASNSKALFFENKKMEFKSFDADEMKMELRDGFEFKMDDKDFFKKSNKVVLGVFPDMNNQLEKGVQLSGVVKNGGAEKAGLKEGDIVLEIDGQAITEEKGIGELIKDKQEGDEVKVKYTRDGAEKMATIALSKSKASHIFIKDRLANFPSKHGKRKVIIIRKKSKKTDIVEEEIIEVEQDNALDLESVKVFPNPTAGQLTVEFQADAAPTTIVIRDVSGKEIFKETLNDFGGNYKKQIDVQNAASGILVVTVQQGKKVFNIKVLKN
jgi:C-terminal processing protease CtpA/Prc